MKNIGAFLCGLAITQHKKLMQAIVDNYPNLTLKKIWKFIVSYYHPSNKINKQISGIVNTNNWTVVEITEDQVYQKIRNYYLNFKKERNTNKNE